MAFPLAQLTTETGMTLSTVEVFYIKPKNIKWRIFSETQGEQKTEQNASTEPEQNTEQTEQAAE